MYKLIVHKGDYITYKRGERIITECVKDIYKRLDDIGTTGVISVPSKNIHL